MVRGGRLGSWNCSDRWLKVFRRELPGLRDVPGGVARVISFLEKRLLNPLFLSDSAMAARITASAVDFALLATKVLIHHALYNSSAYCTTVPGH